MLESYTMFCFAVFCRWKTAIAIGTSIQPIFLIRWLQKLSAALSTIYVVGSNL